MFQLISLNHTYRYMATALLKLSMKFPGSPGQNQFYGKPRNTKQIARQGFSVSHVPITIELSFTELKSLAHGPRKKKPLPDCSFLNLFLNSFLQVHIFLWDEKLTPSHVSVR